MIYVRAEVVGNTSVVVIAKIWAISGMLLRLEKGMKEEDLNKAFVEQSQLMMQLILRITALEKALIDHKIVSAEELSRSLKQAANQIDEVMKSALEKSAQKNKLNETKGASDPPGANDPKSN